MALVLTLHTHRYKILNVLWWLVGLGIPLGIAYSRMYRGMHHLSDVAWGFLLGLVCVAVAAKALLSTRHTTREGVRTTRTAWPP
nr:hypothetical protein GCM10020093_067990 [Planobispora longispora]